MVRTPATQVVRFSYQKLIAHARSLSPTPSTGKLSRRQTNDVDSHPNARLYSTLFRKNYAMLATVFAAGFAWEIGFNSTMDKIWDSNNRGRQWKDIRNKYVEGAEDEE
ncbi:ubiquinol-cytochrome C reductase [Trichoderma sp. SZMC 28014]